MKTGTGRWIGTETIIKIEYYAIKVFVWLIVFSLSASSQKLVMFLQYFLTATTIIDDSTIASANITTDNNDNNKRIMIIIINCACSPIGAF